MVSEEIPPEEDLNAEDEKANKLEEFEKNANACTRKIESITYELASLDYLIHTSEDVEEFARLEKPEWHQPMMLLISRLVEQKESLEKKKKALYAQRAGYLEFIRKLENNEQLELKLE